MPRPLNIDSIKRDLFIWSIIGVVLFAATKPFDRKVFEIFADNIHTPLLDTLAVFMTEQLIYGLLAVFMMLTLWRVWKNPNHHSKLVPGAFSLAATGIIGTVLKQFFAVPRPFLQFTDLEPLVHATFSSFPSNHTAIAFSLLIPIYRVSKWFGIGWGVFAVLVGIARVYQNVHFPSDIAGGIFLGGLIGAFFSNPNTEILLKKWWQRLEFRRQSFHFLAGFLCVFLHWTGVLRWRFILILLVLGLALSLLSLKQKIPLLSDLLKLFDRKRDYDFPGRGAFYFLLGIFLSIIFFPVKIAYASILILSVGDSLNHLFFARTPKKVNIPWNRKKNLIGLILGITAGTFAAQFFVPLWAAFTASSIALIAETIIVRIGTFYVDDNVLVPLVAGGVLLLIA